jgi:Chaperone of endosialidase
MKTKTLNLRKSSGHSLVRRGFVLSALTLICFALSQPALAKPKKKTPTGVIRATSVSVSSNKPIDTTIFTGLGLQYNSGTGEGAIMSSFADAFGLLTFYTKNGPGQPITERMVIDSNGKVGIGTSVPVAQLQVEGTQQLAFGGTPTLSIGTYTASHLEMDNNEIQAGFDAPASSHPSTLFLNFSGGDIRIGNASSTTTVFGTFVNSSDRDIKEDFVPVNAQAVLDQLQTLPLSTWKYKGADGRRHIGPMAQDFHAAFDRLLDLKSDDKTIAPLDEAGVAFAAIQALQAQVIARDEKIAALKAGNASLEKKLASYGEKLAALEASDQAREARLTRLENNGPARAVNAVLARK